MTSQPDGMPGIAPIFGADPSCFISGAGHLTLPIHDFKSDLSAGFSLVIDVQPEVTQSSVLFGAGLSSKASLVALYNADNVNNQIRLDISDDAGRMLSTSVQLSKYAAKRLFITVDFQQLEVHFYELNLLPKAPLLETKYLKKARLQSFITLPDQMFIGGAFIDGGRQGEISAKFGRLAVWNHVLQDTKLAELFAASRRQFNQFNATALYQVDESQERRALFRDDMRKLQEWVQKPHLSGADTREAAVMLYRWLLDRHPMLQDLCNELGIQLSFPGSSNELKNLHQMTEDATFGLACTLGKRNILGYQWVTREEFAKTYVMTIEGTQIHVDQFVKFVRNKLGGGHLDARDRKKWQRELGKMSRYYVEDSDFVNHHMKEVLIAVWEGVWENRIEQHAGLIAHD